MTLCGGRREEEGGGGGAGGRRDEEEGTPLEKNHPWNECDTFTPFSNDPYLTPSSSYSSSSYYYYYYYYYYSPQSREVHISNSRAIDDEEHQPWAMVHDGHHLLPKL